MIGNARRRVFLHVVLTGALPAVCPCQLSVPAPTGESEPGGRKPAAGLRPPAFPQPPQERSGSYMSVRCRRVGSSRGTAVRWFPSRYLAEEHREQMGDGHPHPHFPRGARGPDFQTGGPLFPLSEPPTSLKAPTTSAI